MIAGSMPARCGGEVLITTTITACRRDNTEASKDRSEVKHTVPKATAQQPTAPLHLSKSEPLLIATS